MRAIFLILNVAFFILLGDVAFSAVGDSLTGYFASEVTTTAIGCTSSGTADYYVNTLDPLETSCQANYDATGSFIYTGYYPVSELGCSNDWEYYIAFDEVTCTWIEDLGDDTPIAGYLSFEDYINLLHGFAGIVCGVAFINLWLKNL